MGRYLIRRLLTAIPTLIAISFIIFAVLDLAPGDPTGNLPLTIRPEVRIVVPFVYRVASFTGRGHSWLHRLWVPAP